MDNPTDEESLAYSSGIYKTIDAAIQSKSENNCNVIRVLFSYDVSHPCDVCEQVPRKILQWHINDIKDNAYSEILYIDNQNRHGAALATDSEEHNRMLPRMLCDFMLLMSAQGSQYNIRNAAHCDDKVFSIGYAECMYYYPDVRAYYDIAYQYDIRKLLILDRVNSSTSLDYRTAPFGISERIERLRSQYGDVPYDVDINQYPNSNDKQIDAIICQHRERIIAIKQSAMEEAIAKDEAATAKKREKAAQEGREDIENIIIKTEQERVNREYPDYIDRQQIYTQWLQTSRPKEKFDDNTLCINAKKQYLHLIDFVQSITYKSSLTPTTTPTNSTTSSTDNDSAATQDMEEHSGCNLFARWFGKKKEAQDAKEESCPSNTTTATNSSNNGALLQIKRISELLEEKEQYRELCRFEKKTKEECKDYKKQMEHFLLTSHCTSVDYLIDLQRLRTYECETADKRMHEVETNWLNREEKVHTLSGLHEENNNMYEKEMTGYTFIDWENPLRFIKDIDVERVCKKLHDKATPLVNSCIVRTHQEQNTTYLYYTDHSLWAEKTKDKDIELPYGATMECSTHIASKLALFHILKWDENIIAGLTDISPLSEQPRLQNMEQANDIPNSNSDTPQNTVEDISYEEVEQ